MLRFFRFLFRKKSSLFVVLDDIVNTNFSKENRTVKRVINSREALSAEKNRQQLIATGEIIFSCYSKDIKAGDVVVVWNGYAIEIEESFKIALGFLSKENKLCCFTEEEKLAFLAFKDENQIPENFHQTMNLDIAEKYICNAMLGKDFDPIMEL